jgi:hypothetical protein
VPDAFRFFRSKALGQIGFKPLGLAGDRQEGIEGGGLRSAGFGLRAKTRVHLGDLPARLRDGLQIVSPSHLFNELETAVCPRQGRYIGIMNDV